MLGILGMVLMNKPQHSSEEQGMKLINQKSGFVVAEYQGENTIIHDRILAKEMAVRGVIIPPAIRSEYDGKSAVRLNDKEFQKAFKELYSPQVFNAKNYRWEDWIKRITSWSDVWSKAW